MTAAGAAERTPFHWEMVDGDFPVPYPESHEEALEMALTLSLVCTDSEVDEFVEMAEELADDGMSEETVGDLKIKANANANAIWAERHKLHSPEKWVIWMEGGNPDICGLSGMGVSE